uniref:Uncharacterized protein n=1 Tax=Arundo donax TaxID=35708 RepID=A0A0A8Y452_ARUDO
MSVLGEKYPMNMLKVIEVGTRSEMLLILLKHSVTEFPPSLFLLWFLYEHVQCTCQIFALSKGLRDLHRMKFFLSRINPHVKILKLFSWLN